MHVVESKLLMEMNQISCMHTDKEESDPASFQVKDITSIQQ